MRQEIDRRKAEILAAADAEQNRLRARGEADAILARYEAEAEGLRKVLQSKADGYRALVDSCGGDARAAASLLMIEKIESLVAAQVAAIQNLKIDKITVWDGGGGDAKSSTANVASSLIRSLPPLHSSRRPRLQPVRLTAAPPAFGLATRAKKRRRARIAAPSFEAF